jgi:hypoxanthine phosphoribosyltransferase
MIKEGVKYIDDNFIFNFEHDGQNDIIKLCEIKNHESQFMEKLYYYGYKFEDDSKSEVKSQFIKNIKSNNILKTDIFKFVFKSVEKLDKEINLSTIDCVIFPETRGELVNEILKKIYDYSHSNLKTIELVKNTVENIKFDYDAFQIFFENYNSSDKKIIKRNIEKMLEEAKSFNYFSIANAVKKPKYRNFFKNFLIFKNDKDKKIFEKLENSRILIIDDINTSGSTLKECLRVLNMINNKNEKIIFTLIGNNIKLD